VAVRALDSWANAPIGGTAQDAGRREGRVISCSTESGLWLPAKPDPPSGKTPNRLQASPESFPYLLQTSTPTGCGKPKGVVRFRRRHLAGNPNTSVLTRAVTRPLAETEALRRYPIRKVATPVPIEGGAAGGALPMSAGTSFHGRRKPNGSACHRRTMAAVPDEAKHAMSAMSPLKSCEVEELSAGHHARIEPGQRAVHPCLAHQETG
jgi:hypothetical protein